MERRDELGRLLRRFFRPRRRQFPSLSPGCPFGAVVGERLGALEREVAEVKSRLNWLLVWLSAALAADIAFRWWR